MPQLKSAGHGGTIAPAIGLYADWWKAGRPMSSENIADYRNQAEECLSRAQTAISRKTMLLWLTIAEDWLLLADRAEMNEDRSAVQLVGDGDAKGAQWRAPASRQRRTHRSAGIGISP